MESPLPLFAVLIKVGVTETLTVIMGIAYGAASGFLTGFLIIFVSDFFLLPDPSMPFIASIIGLIGIIAGLNRKWLRNPTSCRMATIAVPLTLLSETLQNGYVSVFYGIPFPVAMASGLPSLAAALANNVVLFAALGPKLIKLLPSS